MKRIVLISSAMMALGTITASAQMPKLNAGIMSKIKSAMAKVIKKESTIVGNVATTGMDLKTTRPCKTTSYNGTTPHRQNTTARDMSRQR